jgi:hypothetical protein
MRRTSLYALVAGLAGAAMFSSLASAATTQYQNDFASDAGDWIPNGATTLTWSNGAVEAVEGSPYSYFGGVTSAGSGTREIWPTHGYITQLDVNLDPRSMTNGQGFDLTVAASKKDGSHLRDFVFHVGKTASGEVRVAADNNAYPSVTDSILAGGPVITTPGLYTFQHVFYDKGDGTLAVDLNVLHDGTTVFHTTRNTASDVISTVVGGPRYQWFTFIDGTVEFDNQLLVFMTQPDITLRPVAGRYAGTPGKYVGGGNAAKAYKNVDGSYTLAKLASTETNAYAALVLDGVNGQRLDELGTFSFDIGGHLGAGSPRMNLYWDNHDGDTVYDGYALVGSSAVTDRHFSIDPNTVPTFAGAAPTSNATVSSMSILVDEQGTSQISNVTLDGVTLG